MTKPRMVQHTRTSEGSFKTTEIGRINRKIEESVSAIFSGERGASGEALKGAQDRESHLFSKPKPVAASAS